MTTRGLLITSLMLCSLTLVPAGAHLLSLPNKINLGASDYLVAQQAYTGWNLTGVLVIAALISTGLLAWRTRHDPSLFFFAACAFFCILTTQLVFWTMNFPGNQQTEQWTRLPEHWERLRFRWEWGHAASAILNLLALASLLALTWRRLPD